MKFSKMHGLGNDFMVVDAITQNVSFSYKTICYLSNRHRGIGFDQLLIIEPPYSPKIDFHYRIFNANGTEVNQCGNGVRCVAKFVYMKKLTYKRKFCISTKTKYMTTSIINDDIIHVNMGQPEFNPKKIPFNFSKMQNSYIINICNQPLSCGVVSIGNPHCIIKVQNINNANVEDIGKKLVNCSIFPDHANIGFMQIINCNYIKLRVYERGIGETQSCGSGACAAVAVGIKQGLLSEQVNVDLLGGRLLINWKGTDNPLYMTGPATHIYDGSIYL